ncbi:MAG: thiamine pyrophosphate-dependent dehydrogenase E1 component subunit alpha [Methylococcaceae bacterium]|nr:MAG: thiamine pyrophosphate-dependent dehydrogenase E1 component subunit alpha [Methylococcaceae bacterium]
MNVDLALRLLFQMQRIRRVEEEIALRYPQNRMRCPTHLSTGQEAVPAAIAEVLRKDDFAVSTHRGHAHYLAKGGNLPALIAEIYGKASGCSRGKGGSMHLIDLSVGFMGTSAIVGNSIPIGVGLGLSAQLRGSDQISCVFLGDGAIEEGVFYESLNFAALRCLPVLFVCENNLYSVYSPLAVRQPSQRSIAGMAAAIGVAAATCDGNDALACYDQLREAVAHIRRGNGPRFLEFATYRWREHCGPAFDNDLGYRAEAEFLAWQAREPLARLESRLLAADGSAAPRIAQNLAAIEREVLAAFAYAEDAAFPAPEAAFQGVYCE